MDLKLRETRQMDLKQVETFLFNKTSSISLWLGSHKLLDSRPNKRFLYMEEISSIQVTPTGILAVPRPNWKLAKTNLGLIRLWIGWASGDSVMGDKLRKLRSLTLSLAQMTKGLSCSQPNPQMIFPGISLLKNWQEDSSHSYRGCRRESPFTLSLPRFSYLSPAGAQHRESIQPWHLQTKKLFWSVDRTMTRIAR